ncbi:MAG: lamin tail domain-containing protein [Verrucomicrobiales bacterium]|nr:lamin tail domain-containing protein [Verrucomicrobiales bacterium]
MFTALWARVSNRLSSRSNLWLLVLVACLPAYPADIVINEVYHHPVGTNLLEQWFELSNPGSTAVDLSGWRVAGDVTLTCPADTSVPAGGWLVVAADGPTFAAQHPGVTRVVSGWSGVLRHRIQLKDAAGNVVDELVFYGEGDWAVRVLGEPMFGHRGWEWRAPHDGAGHSLELITTDLPNEPAHNWSSSLAPGGTPGSPNSTAAPDVAPLILDVHHHPPIPLPADPVAVTARVLDEQLAEVAVTLHWRADGAPDFTVVPMADDGSGGDSLAGDGIFGALVPPQANGTVVEFFIDATDAQGHRRLHPAYEPPTDSDRTANLLYQVDNSTYAGAQPLYRIIMRENERAELRELGRQFPDADSDAQMNATWITTDGVLTGGTTTQVRYNAGVRNRGHGTRTSNPNNYHLDLPEDRHWKGQGGINLNSHYAYSQILGSAIFRRLGVPAADSRPVQVRVNGVNLMADAGDSFGSYAANEHYNQDFVRRTWPRDPNGNSYRGIRDPMTGVNSDADLVWHGDDPTDPDYAEAYFKENNLLENDWSDLIELIGVLNETPGYSSAETYVEDVQRVVNVDEWMRYMAINTLLDNNETCLATGVGDDYALYRGVDDARFLVLPYDLDTLLGRGQTGTPPGRSIGRMNNLPVIERFMKTPGFAPRYFHWLEYLARTAFTPEQMNPLIDQVLGEYVPQGTIDNLKAYRANQVAHVLSQFPRTLTVVHELTVQDGYARATEGAIALHGTAPAAATRSVHVNGVSVDWSAWEGAWDAPVVVLTPGLNRIRIAAAGEGGSEVARTELVVWFDDGSTATVGGTLGADTTWTASGGPYLVGADLTIVSGATLVIEPGTTIYLDSGVDLTVANGGRLLAEGTAEAPIRFGRVPGGTSSWGGLTINGGAGSPETRIAYTHFEFNSSTAIHSSGGAVFLDHLTFGTTTEQYVSLDNSSFVVSHCVFPAPSSGFEPVHGSGGIKSGGRGIFLRNFFGAAQGYNDIIDFTGGNRPGPILQVIENVFAGSGDDHLDLDSTDAWIEGNIFLHAHKNGSPDTASGVSGGADNADTSEVTIIGNLFYDCDQAAMAKQGNYFTLINNTIVHQTHEGGLDTEGAVVAVADEGTSQAAGLLVEANVMVDIEQLVRLQTSARVTFRNNLMPLPWDGPGGGNSTVAPLLNHLPQLDETFFNSWEEAQVMWEWFALQPGSPALQSGPNGRDRGGVISRGAAISGEPRGVTRATDATLTVGMNRSGDGIPSAGWPDGAGFTHYRFRLDDGAWSTPAPTSLPIVLSDLAPGPHRVEVSGRNDAGFFQDDPELGPAATVTRSLTWTVDPDHEPAGMPTIRLSEILARNRSTFLEPGLVPDLIELENPGSEAVDLSGMGLTDNVGVPHKFVFPAGTMLAAGGRLVVIADDGFGGAHLHTGFALKASGDDLSLFDTPARGGRLIDSVAFGVQLEDLSIGRRTDGTWGLCRPTFGGENEAVATGRPDSLRLNEWLTDAQFSGNNDFLELFNPDPLPVALGGLFLSDAAGAPRRHAIAALSFIGGLGFTEFVADNDPGQGADHLNFKLAADVGLILLSAPDGSLIDAVNYGPQTTDVSEGRSPNGRDGITRFIEPTPGAGNPGAPEGDCTLAVVTVPLLPLDAEWRFNDTQNLDGVEWRTEAYDDSGWSAGPALLGVESSSLPAPGLQTPMELGRITCYFRTRFLVETNLDGFDLSLTTVLDDGALVYLNGEPLLRVGLDTAAPAYDTRASRTVGNAVREFFTVPASALVAGENLLAVEVHQTSSSSSDMVWGLALDATRTYTNCAPGAAPPVVINEVLAANASFPNFNGRTADHVELFNPSDSPVDLAGLSLTDDPAFARKWVFPVGASLAPGAYQVVYCDANQAPSEVNSGFGLDAQGGRLFLFNTPGMGGGLLDALSYGLQTPDFALARVPDGDGAWNLAVPTPGAPNQAAALGSISALCVNEWMADPAGSDSDWFELHNRGEQPVALGGLFLTDDFTDRTKSPIPPLSFIGARGNAFVKFIADGDAGAGANHAGFSLKKGGEALGVFSAGGALIDAVSFGNQTTGVSQGRFPDGAVSILDFSDTASPGGSNHLPLATVVINEVLSHTDPPFEDAIEVFNPTASSVAISGWYLSNSPMELRKYRIPDETVIAAGGFAVFYEAQFNGPDAGAPFNFNSAHGDRAILSQAAADGELTGFRSEVSFGAAANGISFGRHLTSEGVDFTALTAPSFGIENPVDVVAFRTGRGAPNAEPLVGPVVISEIMYHPVTAGYEDPAEEFLEIENLSFATVPLFDPRNPENSWRLRDSVDFDFPRDTTLAARSRLLVVGFDPGDAGRLAAFRARFNAPVDVPVLGPWSGRLGNAGDSVELVRPDAVQLPPHPDAGYVPQILVDRVRYRPAPPWPDADGNGLSLQRSVAAAYGNEPLNWLAAAPTAGLPPGGAIDDQDDDGLPDAWEREHFGTLTRDGSEDFDGDGQTDGEEFLAGTDPRDPADALRLLAITALDYVSLDFSAVAGRSYAVEFRDALGAGTWEILRILPARIDTVRVTVTDAAPPDGGRFYRLVLR